MSVSRATRLWPVMWLALALAYFLTGRLCIAVSALVANVSWVLFIPVGLSTTCALLWGSRVWPGVLLGEFAIVAATGQPLSSALVTAIGNSLDAALVGWWFHDRLGRRIEFDRLAEVARFLAAELLVLQPLSTAAGMLGLKLGGVFHQANFWTLAGAWYAANIFAVLVVAPTAVVWIRWKRPAAGGAAYRELLALAGLTLLVGAFGPGRWAIPHLPLPVALICSFPLLVWAAVRFVPSVAVTVGAVLGLFAFDAVLAGGGPLRGDPVGDQMFYLNVFMTVCLGTSLFLAAAMGQEHRFESEQARLIGELKASSTEVRNLKEIVTFCAWTGRVRWKDQWVSVETFLQERYNLNISHGISTDALAKLRQDLPAAAPKPTTPPEA
ncbi:MAG TPA: MASE1 domain-containing protein [Opitutus sp.]|nr:MASE1 domain-containing protein [Opitutus sp.]